MCSLRSLDSSAALRATIRPLLTKELWDVAGGRALWTMLLVLWSALGGHLCAPETLNLLFGHLLYGMLVGTIALFAAAISDNAATAAIITLAFTIASWVLDFTAAGHPGILEWLSRLSLTQM